VGCCVWSVGVGAADADGVAEGTVLGGTVGSLLVTFEETIVGCGLVRPFGDAVGAPVDEVGLLEGTPLLVRVNDG
jgi:hypothetical protein